MLAAALVSIADGALMVGLPFLTLSLGGSPSQVGLVGGLPRLLYVIGLLLGRPLLDRFDLRLIAVCGCLGLGATTLAMPTASSLGPLFVAVALYGVATSLFWPPLVGLLFAGYRGRSLNRRLGQFNMAWSGGMVAGPWLGGELYTRAFGLPFWAAAVMFALAALGILFFLRYSIRAPASLSLSTDEAQTSATHAPDERTRVFHRMARLALISSYLVLGLLRYQLPNLSQELEINEATFGRIGTVLSLSLAVAFFLLGRASGWHYRAWLLWLGQAVMAGSLLILLLAASAWHLTICVLIAGQGIGLMYTSHLFYGSSAGSNRARVMTMHEVLLSIGFLLGAYGGGLIADATGNRALYGVACGAILIGVAAQVGVWLLATGRSGSGGAPGGRRAAPEIEP